MNLNTNSDDRALRQLYRRIQTIVNAPTDDFRELANLLDRNLKRDLSGATLRQIELVNANLQYGDFQETDFSDANLDRSNFRHAKLENAILQRAILTHVNLRGARLDRADFSNSDLRFADLRGATLENTKFENADIRQMVFGHNPDICPDLTNYFTQGGAIFKGS